MMPNLLITPLKGTIEIQETIVHFEAMESEEPDGLPGQTDWWIEKLVDIPTNSEFAILAKIAFELKHGDQIHEAIRAYCQKAQEESDYEQSLRRLEI